MNSPLIITIFFAMTGGVLAGPIPGAPENIHRPNPWELSGKFEGDIILTPEQRAAVMDDFNPFTGHRNLTARWATKIVPVAYSEELNVRPRHRDYIERAMRTIEAAAPCLRFVPYVAQEDLCAGARRTGWLLVVYRSPWRQAAFEFAAEQLLRSGNDCA